MFLNIRLLKAVIPFKNKNNDSLSLPLSLSDGEDKRVCAPCSLVRERQGEREREKKMTGHSKPAL